MDTTLQELIYQFMMLIVTAVLTLIGSYIKQYIQTKIDIAKYGFENDRVERIIDNAVHFAEQKAKDFSKVQSKKVAGSEKLDMARDYINMVDNNIIAKYGNQLNSMIERKVAQRFGVK